MSSTRLILFLEAEEDYVVHAEKVGKPNINQITEEGFGVWLLSNFNSPQAGRRGVDQRSGGMGDEPMGNC